MSPTPRIGAVIPARSTSERLPGKQLADLGGAPVIVRMIERLASSRFIAGTADVVLCTTEDPADDELAAVAQGCGASVFRGDADDLIRRLGDAVEAHGFDIVIEADGDDPFIEMRYTDDAVQLLLDDSAVDVVLPPTLPLGLAAKVVRGTAFQTVRRAYRTTANDTGFMYFFTRSGLCSVRTLDLLDPRHARADIRLTLDYAEDLELMRTVFTELHGAETVFCVDELVGLFERRPELVGVNSHLSEGYWERTRDLVNLEFEVDGELRVIREADDNDWTRAIEPAEPREP